MGEADNVSLRSQVRYTRKLCEGWLEHKTHRANGSTYIPYWLVLKGDILYIFKSRETTSDENLIGSLTIDEVTQFKADVGDARNGYKFDLNTRTRKNRFKSKKLSERELWRGYIIGVATSRVPDDLDLLESQVEAIRADVHAYKTGQPVGPNYRVSMISGDSGDSGVEGSMASGFSDRRSMPESQSGSGSRGSAGSGGSGGGPTMVHKFYQDMSSERPAPSWFFSGCSREKAQEILTRCSNYGNTLMRESTSHMQSGSYVISKRVWDKRKNDYVFEKFEVIRVSGGYKLDVHNEHSPMRCLSDVMEYFKETSGGSTRLMDTNDPYRVGLPRNPSAIYDKVVRRMDPEPWTWPPPDYEDPNEEPAPQPRYPGGGANTVTPGIIKKSKTPGAKKSVDFSHRNTYGGAKDRPYPQTTMDEIAQMSQTAASLRDFDDMIHGFEQDNVYVNDDPRTNPDVDQPSSRGVSRTQMPLPPTPHEPVNHRYINEESITLHNLPVAPPPPLTTTANSIPNHVHDNHDDLHSLPMAPPPPVVQSAKNSNSINSNARNQSSVQAHDTYDASVNGTSIPMPPPPPPLQGAPKKSYSKSGEASHEVKLPVKAPKTPQQSATKPSPSQSPIGTKSSLTRSQTVKSTQSPTAKSPPTTTSNFSTDIAQKRAQLKKTNSEGSGLGSKINTRSPDSMPTWDTRLKPQSSDKGPSNSATVMQSVMQNENKQIVNATQETTSGVDESNPGGVSNLSKMFENSAKVTNTPQVTRQKTPQRTSNGGRFDRHDHRKSAPVKSFQEDYLHPTSFTNTTSSRLSLAEGTLANRTALDKGAHVSSITDNTTTDDYCDDFYDDTAIPGTVLPARAQSQDTPDGNQNQKQGTEIRMNGMDNAFTPPSTESLSRRRQTDPGPLLHKTQGFNASFKRKLEGVLSVPKSPGSPTKVDHEYEELPIKPDAVTYANEVDY